MSDTVNEDVSERLRVLRVMLDKGTQQEMADFLGVEFNRYNNVERGHPLGHDLAVRICRKVPGMTLDWLYFDKPDGLPLHLSTRIAEARSVVARPSKRRRAAPRP